MAILLDTRTRALVQGLTGKEGLKAAISMRDYGTPVVAGVTPGKGGTTVEGFPVYNTARQAVTEHSEINCSVLYVPAPAVFDAALEAIEAGIKLIVIITEHVPVQDTSRLRAIANYRGARIIGPSSIGIIAPGIGKIGSIGGFDPTQAYSRGPVAILSKSGGMSSEIAHMLTAVGIGQSCVTGIGGDRICASSFADLLPLLEHDAETKLVVLYGEIGGTYEEDAAVLIRERGFTKPLIACISGLFAGTVPRGVNLGHAGAIINGHQGTRESKVLALRESGAVIVHSSDEIPVACQRALTQHP